MKPRIIITGVAGFIGSNLADYLLARDYSVIGIDDLSYGVEEQIPDNIDFHQIDVTSTAIYPLIQKGDIIFHLAAKNCISDCQNYPVETAHINVTGTVNIFEAAKRAGAKKVIYAESSALYEGSTVFPTPESEVRPESFYAISKLAGMAFANAYHQYYKLNTTALRYFCAYGPRQDYRRSIPPVMSAFIIKLLREEAPIIYGAGDKRRDFVHVDDINRFHLMCINDSRTDNRAFNLGSGVSYSVNEIFDTIANLLQTNIKPQHADKLPGEAFETRADISAANELGWQPQVSLEKGLQHFIDYYRESKIPWNIVTA